MKKLLVILGPTATGKTDLGLTLAKKFNGEVIACDSRQVYKGLNIGTGKLPGYKVKLKKQTGFWEIGDVKVWMYDVADPKIQYSVADYVKDANAVTAGVIKRDKLPILIGGTGLYLKALLYGLSNLSVPINLRLRKRLGELSLEQLQNKLKLRSYIKWKKMNSSDRKNKRRLIRAIEVVVMSPYKSQSPLLSLAEQNYDILKIGLTASREVLYHRIDSRLMARVYQGMIKEGQRLHQLGLSFLKMHQLGLEYSVLADYLEGKITKEQLVQNLKTRIHQFAKRQLSWFKKETDVIWFDIADKNFANQVEKVVAKWYYLSL